MKNTVGRALSALVLVACIIFAQVPGITGTAAQEPIFRAPFVLKLRVDDQHYYEEHFEKVPYVAENDVYLFAGENFGINVAVAGNQISQITYQRDPAKCDVEFKFTQEQSPKGLMMVLVTRNRLKRRLSFDALMTVPEKEEIYKTSVLPVEPSLSNFESWPHPIVQLVLRNFRFSENGPKQSAGQEKPKDHTKTDTVDPKTGDLRLQIPVVASTKPKH
jgi:hypothetical protein